MITAEMVKDALGCDGHYVRVTEAPEVGGLRVTHDAGDDRRTMWLRGDLAADTMLSLLREKAHAPVAEYEPTLTLNMVRRVV